MKTPNRSEKETDTEKTDTQTNGSTDGRTGRSQKLLMRQMKTI